MWRSVSAAGAAVALLAACSSGRSAPRRAETRPVGTSSIETITLPPDTGGAGGASGSSGRRAATVLGSGDVLIHPPLWQQAHADALAEGRSGYDFGPMYASIAPDVRSADLATCEMETPLAPPGGPFVGWPNFSAPPQVLTALKGVGYRSCTTASNHTLDQGYSGLKRTLDELDAAGLKHTGSARTAGEAATPLILTLDNGVRVGQLAYSFNFNGHEPSAGEAWQANLIEVPNILAAAHRMKQAGADVIVLSLHWGTEYDHLATQQQRQEADALLASPDVDLILGDHAHVVQPAEKIHGKWVFYCMGNQISRHEDPIADSREGVMPRVTFTEVSSHHFTATSVQTIPTWMEDSPKLRLVDVPRALRSGTLTAAQRAADEHARAQIVKYLDAYGAVRDGLQIP
ncbi:MAG: CapA family protein [Jatrophihabitans sp.]|uniref:CapA family protein n=1 Tax=Jatrophihabitans sp. TaxID=1932789 RepID=UPI00390D4468